MSRKIDTTYRSREPEVMDDFDLQGKELKKTLKDLENINTWLGGNQVTLKGVQKLLYNSAKKEIHIADVGCGNGAMLRKIADWGRKKGYNLVLTGIDANPHAIQIAEKASSGYDEIRFKEMNIFSNEFRRQYFDILLCTLTLHHFTTPEIKNLLHLFYRQVEKGIVINDLHRSKLAYRLFQAFCAVFIRNEIAREDGLTSILRGFKKSDLMKFSEEIPSKKQQISWQWAFRYRWIIEKENHL